MFEFQGDFFNAAYVVAIGIDPQDVQTVIIWTAGGDKPFEYGYNSPEEAKQKQAEAVGAWRAATDNQPLTTDY